MFFSWTIDYTFHCVFLNFTFHFSFSFLSIILESYTVDWMIYFRVSRTISQLNGQAATARNKKENIISIRILSLNFQNWQKIEI